MFKITLRELFLVIICLVLLTLNLFPNTKRKPPLCLVELRIAFNELQEEFSSFCANQTPPVDSFSFESLGGSVISRDNRQIFVEQVTEFEPGKHQINKIVSDYWPIVKRHMESHGFEIAEYVSIPEFENEFRCYLKNESGHGEFIFRVETSGKKPAMIARIFAWTDE